MRLSLSFTLLCLILVSSAGSVWGREHLGPRRDMKQAPLSRLHQSLWSDQLELKILDKTPVTLQGNRLVDATGRVVFDPATLPSSVQPATLSPTFATPVATLRARRLALMKKCNCDLGDKANYFRLTLGGDQPARAGVLAKLSALTSVEVAYPVSLPVVPPADIPPTTPDYSSYQGYFNDAPNGIGLSAARALAGGFAEGVTSVDVEYGWDVGHEDLELCIDALVPDAGTLYDDPDYVAHGTSVLGILFAQDNGYGVTGSLLGATCKFAPSYTTQNGYNVARGIDLAHTNITALPGVILLEAQEGGPNFDPQTYGGMVPVEYIPATYDAIREAVADGIVVVEAGANGWEDLDAEVYGDTFNREVSDSGAILVGAGTPPGNPPARTREWYSNWGSRLDVQAWGSLVYTSGYGDLFGPNGDVNQYYTAQFGGTSSASPIVTSAVGLLLGVFRAGNGQSCSTPGECSGDETCDTANFTPGWCVKLLPPEPLTVRRVLTDTGTPQTGDTAEHIGPLPNLALAIEAIAATCGNDVVETGEACDDGNTTGGDGCSADCRSDESCGNGITDLAEICDDGNTASGDGCSADCLSDETCGNNYVDAGEACDDGNTVDADGCSATCLSDETCGNGILDPQEHCEDGNTANGDGCSADCRSDETCGNGYKDVGEECEDGNLIDGDGCSATCRDENKKDDGCGCTAGSRSPSTGALGLSLLLAALFLFRRRRA